MNLTDRLSQLEKSAVDIMAVFAPWLGPIPSAYLVGTAVSEHLGWHPIISWIAAAAVELIGVVSVVLALRLYEWNQTKNKTDPAAPFGLALAVVSVYFIVTIGLTVLLDVVPELARYAPAVFPLLAAVGAVNIALKNGQQRREVAKDSKRQPRQRNQTQPQPRITPQPNSQPNQVAPPEVGQLSGTKLQVYQLYKSNPAATQQDIAEQLGISRQAVSKHAKSLNGMLK